MAEPRASAARAASTNSRISAASLTPRLRSTPELTSTPNGRTVAIASRDVGGVEAAGQHQLADARASARAASSRRARPHRCARFRAGSVVRHACAGTRSAACGTTGRHALPAGRASAGEVLGIGLHPVGTHGVERRVDERLRRMQKHGDLLDAGGHCRRRVRAACATVEVARRWRVEHEADRIRAGVAPRPRSPRPCACRRP